MSNISAKVLVVDDCQNIRHALKRLLYLHGYDFYGAPSAQEGLALLETEGFFDVVIADHFMPQMAGGEFLQQVNRLWPETFCLLLTAFPDCQEIEQLLQQGMGAAVMSKPWSDDLLMQAVGQAIALVQMESIDPATRIKERAAFELQISSAQFNKVVPGPQRNCWESLACGREPGGDNVAELGVCKATIRAPGLNAETRNGGTAYGRACWTVAGTSCGGEVQGTFAQKHANCFKCSFYQEVQGSTVS